MYIRGFCRSEGSILLISFRFPLAPPLPADYSSFMSTLQYEPRHVLERREAESLRDLTSQQWKSGVAAWLGWFFDGLDMHLYTIIAAPFVAHLLGDISTTAPMVKETSSLIRRFSNACAATARAPSVASPRPQ